MVARSGGVATAKAIPGAKLMVVEGMGHDLPRGGLATAGGRDREPRPDRGPDGVGRAAQGLLTDDDAERARLRDGSTVRIRPISADDRELLRSGFEELSEHSRYMRFQAPTASLSDKQLAYLTDVDHHDHEALVALASARDATPASAPGEPDIVGVARFIRVHDSVAECAIAVADDWQGRGVGTELLDRLVERARDEQIDRFTALVLAENAEAMRLLERLGDTVQRRVGSQVELDIELPAPATPARSSNWCWPAPRGGCSYPRSAVAPGRRLRLRPSPARRGVGAGQRDRGPRPC